MNLKQFDMVKILKDYENFLYPDYGIKTIKAGSIGVVFCETGNAPEGSPPESYQIDCYNLDNPEGEYLGSTCVAVADIKPLNKVDPEHLIYLKNHPDEKD